MKHNFLKILPAVILTGIGGIMICSCSGNEFRISGEVKDANDSTLYLERGINGDWVTLDSTVISGSGSFSFANAAPESPDIYRLRLGGRYIYFPVDSLDKLTVQTTLKGFGSDFSLSGTTQAERFSAFEKDAAKFITLTDSAARSEAKKELFNKYIKDDQAGLLSYYILTKTVDGKLFFDPEDPKDARMYVAVATAYKEYKPNDPRTAMLEQAAMDLHRADRERRGQKRVIQASTTAMLDIDLKDANGKQQKLSQIAANGKPTVLIFTALTANGAAEQTLKLKEMYNNGGFNIYQVCLDTDELGWRKAAQNLPWTVVYDPQSANSRYLVDYNVGQIPAYFIYNAAGELIDRAFSLDELKRKLH